MNEAQLVWLALAALATASGAAVGHRVLHEFPRRELEVYCRRRRNPQRFSEILAGHNRAALGAETLQLVATPVWLAAGLLWWLPLDAPPAAAELAGGLAVAALVLLVTSSWLPWAVVHVWSAPLLYHTWLAWWALSLLMTPLSVGARLAAGLLRRLTGRPLTEADEEEAFEEEIRTIVSAGLREGLLEQDAREMIEGVIELGDADVFDIMTPRSEVDAIEVNQTWPDVLRVVIDAGRTRIPVYEQSLDQIAGVLYVRDLLPELADPDPQARRPLRKLLRQPWFVPGTKRVDDLLQDFLRTRNHMAIVLDEYRNVAGVVTIEDVLEEIVGEIVDESDKELVKEIMTLDDGVSEALGRTHIDQLNEQLGLELPESDEYDTVGGFVVARLRRIPPPGESIVHDGLKITVLEAGKRRVERVRIEPVEVEADRVDAQ